MSCVRDAQQRLGEAHQHDAFLRRQPEAAQERLRSGGLARAPPDLARERQGAVRDARARGVVEPDARRQLGDRCGLVAAIRPPEGLPGFQGVVHGVRKRQR